VLAQAPLHLWSQSFGDSTAQLARGLGADGSGNIVVTGAFEGSVDFGGAPLVSGGSLDIFAAKYDQGGSHLWSRSFGDSADQRALSVCTDGSGSVIVTGYFEGTVDFGGGPLTSAGLSDIFVAKFASDGSHLWSQRFGDAAEQEAIGIAVDTAGSVFFTGFFIDETDFGGGPLTSAGSLDVFLVKLDTNGNHLWSQGFGDRGLQRGQSLAVDGLGNVVITGDFGDEVDFGGGPLVSAGSFDIFVAKFASDGSHIWSQSFGDGSSQNPTSICAGGSNEIGVTGSFQGSVDFGGGPMTSAGSADIFVTVFDASGNHAWSRHFGDTTAQVGTGVMLRPTGNAVVTGFYWGTVDFGGGPLMNVDSSDIFLVEFASDGQHVWSRSYGDSGPQEAWNIVVDGSGEIFLSGDFDGVVDFGGAPLTSAGSLDVFIVKLGTTTTAVPGAVAAPALGVHAHPNPFSLATHVTIALPGSGSVRLGVFDAAGRLVRVLVDDTLATGEHTVAWNGRDKKAATVSPGVYFLRLESSGQVRLTKAVVLK
jgi:hypothetical protein